MYPINLLRNVALDQVRTPFVFLSDIDFLPMPNLYSTLKKAVQSLKVANENKVKLLLLLSVFNTHKYRWRQNH